MLVEDLLKVTVTQKYAQKYDDEVYVVLGGVVYPLPATHAHRSTTASHEFAYILILSRELFLP